jgi:hypothetical protein
LAIIAEPEAWCGVTTILSTPAALSDLARRLLPPAFRVVHGSTHTHFFYQEDAGTFTFLDPIDGEVLIESRRFVSLRVAEAWLAAEAA